MPTPSYPVTITASEFVTPSVKRIQFEFKTPFSYVPGQFVSLQIPHDGDFIKRSYSIANTGHDFENTQTIEIVISHVEGGRATEFLFSAEPGTEIELSGPLGALTLLPEHPERTIFIATGTGVAPYRTMLPHLSEGFGDDQSFHILQGVREPDELLFRDCFVKYSENNDNIHFHACYSRVMPEDSAHYEKHGYVQEHLKALEPNPATDLVYLCGNPAMVDEVYKMLKELEFEVKQVKREKYAFSKR